MTPGPPSNQIQLSNCAFVILEQYCINRIHVVQKTVFYLKKCKKKCIKLKLDNCSWIIWRPTSLHVNNPGICMLALKQ